ncbi:hypothetical protein HHI36_009538 [Cryptolaemus montrouzieri]|uniref:Uncharacterized protein n=1 Tax=Cryptolaemus montrouzieri TaxID=559131 RepID=A0ABD2MFZ8_9CUCU
MLACVCQPSDPNIFRKSPIPLGEDSLKITNKGVIPRPGRTVRLDAVITDAPTAKRTANSKPREWTICDLTIRESFANERDNIPKSPPSLNVRKTPPHEPNPVSSKSYIKWRDNVTRDEPPKVSISGAVVPKTSPNHHVSSKEILVPDPSNIDGNSRTTSATKIETGTFDSKQCKNSVKIDEVSVDCVIQCVEKMTLMIKEESDKNVQSGESSSLEQVRIIDEQVILVH